MALTIECVNNSYQGLGGSYYVVKNQKANYTAVVTAQGGRALDPQKKTAPKLKSGGTIQMLLR